jgi:voltage-gated potassium channel
MVKINKKYLKHKYEFYLISLLVLLFAQHIEPPVFHSIWKHVIVVQNVLVGLLLFDKERYWKKLVVWVLAIIMIAECFLHPFVDAVWIDATLNFLFVFYFILTSNVLFRDILKAKTVSSEMLSAVFSGFVVLGMIGGFIYTIAELYEPNSFVNIGVGEDKFRNLNYFSFISLLTIGYGDIVPLSYLAKKMAMLVGLAGHFYTTIVAAVVIGKYLNRK